MEKEIALIDENLLKSKIYTIRGVKVMLDADLAEIYGYSTKDFNRQIKNNIERFADDFRFQLNCYEVENLRCKNCTANISSKSRFLPYVFTEQGVYMLMTVLKGELAVRQSMALVRLFKQMKDYFVDNQPVLGYDGGKLAEIAVQTERNTNDIKEIRSDLQKVMDNFIDPSTHKHFLILNGQKLEADVAYTQIYGMAKKSIVIIDDYVGVKSLDLLRGIARGVSVTIYSDERGPERLTECLLCHPRVGGDLALSLLMSSWSARRKAVPLRCVVKRCRRQDYHHYAGRMPAGLSFADGGLVKKGVPFGTPF